MKPDIHPEYKVTTIRCSCGNEIQTRSTSGDIHVEICSSCHPFYTGKQKLIDSAGRVDRFLKKYGKTGARGAASAKGKAAASDAAEPTAS